MPREKIPPVEKNRFSHQYTVDGKRKLSVTDAIPFDTTWIPESARDAGADNHLAIYRYLKGLKIPPDLQSYVDVFRKFENEQKSRFGKLIASEKPYYSSKYGFAGTPDLVYEKGLIDIKRNSNIPYVTLQLAGYNILTAEAGDLKKTKERYQLVIRPEKNGYELRKTYNWHAERIFLGLLASEKAQKAYREWLITLK